MSEAFDRRRSVKWVVVLATLSALAWILSTADIAGASGGGIPGYSGDPATNGGATCSQCHSGGVSPTVTLDGPTSVSSGQTADYTLTIEGGTAGGFGVSATDGVFVAGAGSKITGGEVVQSATKPTAGGEVSWTFSWTAPATSGDITMYGAGNAVNGDFGLGGDGVATDTLTINVVVVNAPPVADPGGPYVDDPAAFVVFDGSDSSDSDGTIESWDWDFGDGSAASGIEFFHSYSEAGVYTVSLMVTDDVGATHTATTTATIGEVSNMPPTADAGGPYSGTTGEAIAFDGSGSSDPEAAGLSYAWDFGDGSTTDKRRPSHAYSSAGSFTVTLTVTDDAALTASDTTTVTVAAAPTTTTSTAAPSVAGIYSAQCAACHGAAGQGAGGPSLQASTMSTSQIQSVIANGATGMPGYSGSLSSSEISGLAGFSKAMQVSGATTTSTPAGGSALYSSKCAGCHGGNGEGGSGPSLQTSTMSSSQIRSIVANGAAGMPGYSASLDSDQISAVSSFTAGLQDSGATTTTLDPAAGGGAAYASQCAGCHGANGEGGIGPAIQTLGLSASEMESVITDGYGGMAGFSDSLTPQQIFELAAFSVGLQGNSTGGSSSGDGSSLFAAHCAACHGVAGEGGIGPALAGTALSASDISSAVVSGSNAMHSLTNVLGAEQVASVADFILTLELGTDDPGDPIVDNDTTEIYKTMCSGCHGAAGEGASAPALVGTQLDTAGLISIIADGQNSMPGYATQLSSTEIEDLALLIGAMGQAHDDPSDAPSTTRTVAIARPEPVDEEGGDGGGSTTRTLGIILLAFVLGSGTYLGFASRATRES